MTPFLNRWNLGWLGLFSVVIASAVIAQVQTTPAPSVPATVATTQPTGTVEARQSAEQFTTAFNSNQAVNVVALFQDQGEFIDEAGTIYTGTKEIQELLTGYFTKYPGVKVSLNIESIRLVGPVAIEEGTRTITTANATVKSQTRYIAIRSKTATGWQLVSLRDFADDEPATAHDNLQQLDWLVGDWVNEGTDATVKISYRWDEGKNFLLGSYDVHVAGKVKLNSSHRIGWDPQTGKIRSWMFDSDGGFAEATWSAVGNEWVIKSSATLPTGQAASATIRFSPKDQSRFTIKGSDRLAGDELLPDFEVTIVKPAPQPTTSK